MALAESTTSFKDWVDDLYQWIGEGQLLTCMEAAIKFKVHINVAKERLFYFWQQGEQRDDEITAVIYLSGRNKQGQHCIRLVRSEEVERIENEVFGKLISKHVYAVGKKPLFKDNLQLTAASLQTMMGNPLDRGLCAVVNKAAVPRQIAPPRARDPPLESSKPLSKPSANEDKHTSKVATSKEEKKDNSDKNKKEVSDNNKKKTKDNVTEKKAKSSGSTGIVGMFAKQIANPAPKKRKAEETTKTSDDISPGKENKINEEKEREDNKGDQYAKKRSSHVKEKAVNKRKRIQVRRI